MGEGENVGRTVSVVQSIKQKPCKPEPYPGDSIIKGIISGAFRKEIEPIREKIEGILAKGGDLKAAKKGVSRQKHKLPAIMWAGHFADRKTLLEHSGLLCIDIDEIGADTRAAIGALRNHPSIYAVFKSPSGDGMKAVFRVPPDEDMHAFAWRAAALEAEKQTGFKADEATKNINSLCFVSHDPEAHHNPDAVELAVSDPKQEQEAKEDEQEAKVVSPEMLVERKEIAVWLLGEIKWRTTTEGFCKCPGVGLHTATNGERDCKVCLNGAPTISCFHNSCRAKVDELNRLLRSEIGKAEAKYDEDRWFVLPATGGDSITESAEKIFGVIGPTNTLFRRGGLMVEPGKDDLGNIALKEVKPAAFRSRLEGYGKLVGAWRAGGKTGAVLKKIPCPEETAKALMESLPSQNLLPKISVVLNAPTLAEENEKLILLAPGYNKALGGVYVASGENPPEVPLDEAVASIKELFVDFNFPTSSDRSRAIASVFTPAFRIGGLIKGHTPIDLAEADQSQSGKGYRHQVIAAIYNEKAQVIARRAGGVGSFDESLSQALIKGRPFITFDNMRGKIDSPALESLMTCDGLSSVRGFRQASTEIDISRFVFQLSSNEMNTTKDLSNRAVIVSILKQPEDHPWKTYPEGEGELLQHVKNRQPYFLGCVFAVIRYWHQQGKPRTDETSHSFREWAQTMDWIVTEVFSEARLLDKGHEAAKERVASPALIWLRALAIVLDHENRLGEEIDATEIVYLCQTKGIPMPGSGLIDDESEDKAIKKIGSLMKKEFGDRMEVTVDQFTITKTEREETRDNYAKYTKKTYAFTKQGGDPQDKGDQAADELEQETPLGGNIPIPILNRAAELENTPIIQNALELFRRRISEEQTPRRST
jgi:hypothetical protein